MKKIVKFLSSVSFVLLMIFTMCACDNEEHVHSYSETYKSNASNHWKECECGVKAEEEKHVFSSWATIKESTDLIEGLKSRKCSICNYEETENIPKLEHNHTAVGDWEKGETGHWKLCSCGEKLDFAGHTFGEWMVVEEATPETNGKEERVCSVCSYKEEKVISILGHIHIYTWVESIPATCETAGSGYEMCSICEQVFSSTEIPAFGHNFIGNWMIVKNPSKEEEGLIERECGNDSNHKEQKVLPKLNEEDYIYNLDIDSGCESTGMASYIHSETSLSFYISVPAKGHVYTINQFSATQHWKECEVCGISGEHIAHTYSDGVCSCGYEKTWGSLGLVYKLNEDGKSYCVAGVGESKDIDLVIPDIYNGLPVTSIAENFIKHSSYRLSLKSVTLGANIEVIGEAAFGSCSELLNVTFSDKLTTIESSAFVGCSKANISIPESVTYIGSNPFYNCLNATTEYENGIYVGNSENPYLWLVDIMDNSELRFNIHEKTKGIASQALSWSNFVSIVIPSELEHIGEYAFGSCYRMVEIYNLSSLDIEHAEFAELGYYAKIIHTSLEEESCIFEQGDFVFLKVNDEYSLVRYTGEDEELIFPMDIDGNRYSINDYACVNSNLTSVTISTGVTAIGDNAFLDCSQLKKLILPYSSETNTEEDGFNVFEIMGGSFSRTELEELIILGGTHIAGSTVELLSNLIRISIPDSVTSFGNNAFYGCNNLYNEYDNALYVGNSENPYLWLIKAKDTKIKNCIIHDQTKHIQSNAFANCYDLLSVVIGENVETIESDSFWGCFRILEIYNLSNLNITLSSWEFWGLIDNAIAVHSSLEEESVLIELDDFVFAKNEEDYLLCYYQGSSLEIVLPANIHGDAYDIYKYAFYKIQTLRSGT
ncbi:MAG: leucine-rich repeat domain-containing protein, partial [Anaeroplasmataceae bacterium]|nr:leucine-rich repeat domain-containing protein [Anaeroplasmataceae bacterium]